MILCLPFTSLPLVVSLVGSNTVGAASGIFLFLLVICWLLPYTVKGGKYPIQTLPLATFGLAAVLSTVLAAFLPLKPFKDVGIIQNEIGALLTLGVGICFYLVTATWPRNSDDLARAGKLLNWSGVIILAAAFIQAAVWFSLGGYPQWMRELHNFFSVGPLFRQRVTAFTLEPSWLANQLNLLYLPFWLAATVQRWSAFRFRILRLTFENLLLIAGIVTLLLTLSRIGLLALLLMLAYLSVRANLWLVRRLQGQVVSRLAGSRSIQRLGRTLIYLSIFVALAAGYLALLFGVGYVLSQVDRRMADVFVFSLDHQNPFLRYAERLNFGARVVYWETGWEIFNDYPWLGVGLGNAGFFFVDRISPFGWKLLEVRELIYRVPMLPNLKSIWVRILAETGIAGFSFFVSWLYFLWQSTRRLDFTPSSLLRTLGWMGKFTLIGLLLEGFSLDSFALPYLWFSAGLVTAAYQISKQIE